MDTNLGGAVDVMQTTNYYPFGLVMNQKSYSTPTYQKNKYLYNGKELQSNEFGTTGLGMYDYITLVCNTGKACKDKFDGCTAIRRTHLLL